MGRPKGSRNRKTSLDAPTITLQELEDDPIQVIDARPFDLVLGIRHIRSGNFSGLWELTQLAVDPVQSVTIKVLTDANVKPIVMAQIGRVLAQCR